MNHLAIISHLPKIDLKVHVERISLLFTTIYGGGCQVVLSSKKSSLKKIPRNQIVPWERKDNGSNKVSANRD